MNVDGYRIEALSPDRFDDFATVVGAGGIGGCWCMYWTAPSSKVWGEGTTGGSTALNKGLFRELVDKGPPPGLLAYVDNEPVGWCRVMARRALPGLANSRFFKTDLDIDGVWSLACFVVRKPHRARGLTSVLTTAAIEFVRDHGGQVLEAYPWDTEERKADSTIYTGVASTFRRLGFEVVQRGAPHKPMMRLDLTEVTSQ